MDTRLMEKRLNETSEEARRDSEANGPTISQTPSSLGNGIKEEAPAALFSPDESRDLRSRWEKIQIGFVDEPRQSVQHADELVAEAIKRLTETFASERDGLEHEWDRGDQVSTEDLRVALRRYRGFFDRLLKI